MKELHIQLTNEEIYELGMALKQRADRLEDRGDPNGARAVGDLYRRLDTALRGAKVEVAS